jgi:hypothetical protein
MGTIEKSIEEFRQQRLAIYKAAPAEIVRNARAADRATKDYTGRWFFELLQNSDDAEAPEVGVFIEDTIVYVADKGKGLTPKAVSAISGTDFSDKTTGTIGRKGVGFKSVYEISSNPQVLTVNGEGIEFSPVKAKEWLRQNKFNSEHVPHQWIPFFISWDEARRQDPILDSLANYTTVIRLPGVSPDQIQKIRQLLIDWPPHALFAFNHVRQIKAPNLQIILVPGDGIWQMNDSRDKTATSWLVASHKEPVTTELMELLESDDRQAIGDGVGFLIATPVQEDRIVSTVGYLPVHVFYPTEQKGPLPLLLHAEFQVKSDRTALIPIEDSPFNTWVAKILACRVCKFVNSAYRKENPSDHIKLLVPFDDRRSHQVAEYLWHRIAEKAGTDLRLADITNHQQLAVNEATMISVSVRPDLARMLLEATDVRDKLLHHEFDEDINARKALKELGCRDIQDQDLIEAIAKNASSRLKDTRWVWTCWEWLTTWVGKEPYGDKHRERVERVKELFIVPVDGDLLKPSELAGRIITWKPNVKMENLPDWLPLTFVEDWFRDRIQSATEQKYTVLELCKEIGIQEPGKDVVQRAVGQAIEQYWKDKLGNPGQFFRFILEQDWHETSEASSALQRCPIPLQNEAWIEAENAYFGREWGNDLLADLYEGIKAVVWIRNDGTEDKKGKCRRVLEWLGVANCPRVIDDPSGHARETKRVKETLPHHTMNDEIPFPKILEHINLMSLSYTQVIALIRLLVMHWENYYSQYSNVSVRYHYYSWYPHSIAALWWNEVKTIPIPALKASSDTPPLKYCWLPDKQTERAIGDLLPIINLDVFENDMESVRHWLVNTVSLPMRIEQLTSEEWKELLSTRIPDKIPTKLLASDERYQDKVTGWYATCLETVAEQNTITEKIFASCPLLCRKGDSWQYIAGEPHYLDDDNDLAKSFAEDIWIFHVPSKLIADAEKYFGVPLLSKSIQVRVDARKPMLPLSDELQIRFNESLPFIWAWRSSQVKKDADKLSFRLKKLKVYVVPTIKAHLDLNGICHEIDRRWDVDGDTLILQMDHANETELAQALAKAMEIRSEGDFYENLFRCNNADQRKDKLLSKGIPDAEVKRLLREYSGRPTEEEESPKEQTKPDEKKYTSPTPSATGAKKQEPEPESNEGQDKKPEKSHQPLHFKDGRSVDYVIGTAPVAGHTTGGGGRGGGADKDKEGHPLTDKEKAKLEEESRHIAVRELGKLHYTVEEMPLDNPGFDLRATKEGEELRVEVKAHTGKATVVDITQRQYKEYLGQQGYRWELWNVEHLAEQNSQPVTITRYENIPDDALDARTFLLDLKKCQALRNPLESGNTILI